MTLGLALGSGGARGWCHIGVLRELKAQGIDPAAAAGCSMGALVGAAWAGGKLDELENWARSLTETRFVQYVDLRLTRGGLVEGRAVMRLMSELGLPERIEDLPKRFMAVATDMSTGREIWLQEGSLAEAVRASVSIPGVFSPINVDGHWLLDGGLVNPVPVSAVRALGARRTIAVNPNAKEGRKLWEPRPQTRLLERVGLEAFRSGLPERLTHLMPPSKAPVPVPAYFDVVSASIDILTEFLRKSRDAADPADVVLNADLPQITVLELYRAAEAIEEGEKIARAAQESLAAISGN